MSEATPIMAGKRGLIMGVANDRSLAWGIAKAVAKHGAELAFTFQGEALGTRVRPLAGSLGSSYVMPCDVTDDASVDATFSTLAEAWGDLDFVVHAIAFSDKDELKGKYVNTSRDNFNRTLDISCYSLTAVAQRAVPLMRKGGSLVTLTYYGAERVYAALQCHGGRQGGVGGECPAIWRSISAIRTYGSMRFQRDLLRRLQPPGLAISAIS